MRSRLLWVCVAIIAAAVVAAPRDSPRARTGRLQLSATDLTGEYYYGDGLGANCTLVIDASGRFSYEWTGCLGVYAKNRGTFTFRSDVLTLHPRLPNADRVFGTPTRFFPVRWGDRLYLISDERMLHFCEEVRRGRRHDGRDREFPRLYYLRGADDAKPTSGLPKVPPLYRRYLRDEFGAQVTRVQHGVVTIDRGSDHGVIKRMALFLEPQSVRLRVTRVGRAAAECVFDHPEEKVPVKPGARVVARW